MTHSEALRKAGIPYRKLIVQDATEALFAGGKQYTKSGYHKAIQVGGRVYDSTTGARGLLMNDWIRRGGLTQGVIRYEDVIFAFQSAR